MTLSEALERVGIWLPERVAETLLNLQVGEVALDYILGLVLSVQILHARFIEGEISGDPNFAMVDKTPTEAP